MKAVALFSGGLDSILAVKLVQDQGIEVVGVSFTSPFFGAERAKEAAKELGISLKVVDISRDLMEIVKKPKHGYGKNMNPCIDCHILMAKKAGELMKEVGASSIISGEVLGERPMSQNRQSLRMVERESGYGGYLLRPLSAKLLSPTIPEKEGWVERRRLLDIQGRSRKPQLALARKYGLRKFPTPAGGCLLTDSVFSQRLKDLLSEKVSPSSNDLELLKVGRHFRSSEGKKIVVARRKEENDVLLNMAEPGDFLLQLKDYPSPLTMVRGKDIGDVSIREAAGLTARYSRARDLHEVEVLFGKVKKSLPPGERGEAAILVRAPFDTSLKTK